jgi:hypothetical protein
MNPKVRIAMLKSLGWNFLAGIAGLIPFLVMNGDSQITWGFILIVIAVVSLLIQLIAGIVYANKEETKEKGQGMLISVGIYLLIGMAVCGPMWT